MCYKAVSVQKSEQLQLDSSNCVLVVLRLEKMSSEMI